jgi:hypothetical protein
MLLIPSPSVVHAVSPSGTRSSREEEEEEEEEEDEGVVIELMVYRYHRPRPVS